METLSTLKFAQRAKFIQNNVRYPTCPVQLIHSTESHGRSTDMPSICVQAVVNEDASGELLALKREIQQLKASTDHVLNTSSSPGFKII